jgi:hypothetical protein
MRRAVPEVGAAGGTAAWTAAPSSTAVIAATPSSATTATAARSATATPGRRSRDGAGEEHRQDTQNQQVYEVPLHQAFSANGEQVVCEPVLLPTAARSGANNIGSAKNLQARIFARPAARRRRNKLRRLGDVPRREIKGVAGGRLRPFAQARPRSCSNSLLKTGTGSEPARENTAKDAGCEVPGRLFQQAANSDRLP